MAKKTTAFGGSRALGYQESFFANRNDMLQSALDSVLLNYDNEMQKYEAAVELYKDASKLVQERKDYLIKLRDGLVKEQVKATQAAKQFNAAQLNTTARAEAGIDAANQRYNLTQVFYSKYLGALPTFLPGSAAKGVDDVIQNEANQAYTGSGGNISSSMAALDRQYKGTTEVQKTAQDRDLGRAYLFQQHLGDEQDKPEYQIFDPLERPQYAADALMEKLSDAEKASVTRGLDIQKKLTAGKNVAIDKGTVSSGAIDTQLVGMPSYEEAIADVDARLERLAAAEAAKAPEKPPEPDLITEQRKEYFKSFFPGYMPAFKQNAIATSLNALPDEDAMALLELYRAEKRAETLAGRMPAETPLGEEITDRRPPRYAAGKEGPRMAGDVLGGKGSPFIPVEGAIGSVESKLFDAYADTARRELVAEGVAAPVQDAVPEARLKDLEIKQGAPYSTIEEQARQRAMEAKRQLDEAKSKGLDEKTIATFQTIYDNELKAYSDIFVIGQEPALNEAMREQRTYPFPTPKQADRKEVKKLLPDQIDAKAKIRAAKKVEPIVDTPEFGKLLTTDVGKAVTELWNANKAKGDETEKEVLKYIAREYPRAKDQELAAQVVMGLAYHNKNADKLKLEDDGKKETGLD